MRNRFDEQLEQLHVEMIQMGALCEDAISAAAEALLKGDRDLAESAQEAEREIDQKEREVENRCLKLLLQQQPVAKDLREISAALKMISDLERIGDQAADICDLILHIGKTKIAMDYGHISRMAEVTIQMVKKSIEAFIRSDLDLAKKVCASDDEVDELFLAARRDLIELIRHDVTLSGQAIDMLMIAKYFERIGDHATNIAGWVVFAVTGAHEGEEN